MLVSVRSDRPSMPGHARGLRLQRRQPASAQPRRQPPAQQRPAHRRGRAVPDAGPGQDYYRRKRDQGKTHLEALRCLKRRLSDVVYRHLVDDLAAGSPGGQVGASLQSSAADLIPMASTSEQSLPGLAYDPTPVLAVVS